VVGVVAAATLGSFRATTTPIAYLSALQAGRIAYYPTLQIATDGEPWRIADRVAAIVADMGREYVHTALPLSEWLERSTATEGLAATVANTSALLGTALAAISVYALLLIRSPAARGRSASGCRSARRCDRCGCW
jgi:hypothetical protein